MAVSTAIRIISLPNSPRRSEFENAAQQAKLPWQFFDGQIALAKPLEYAPHRATRRFGRPLTPGELGCYTSHYKVWEEFLLSDQQQIIVMEEDVIADWGVIGRLAGQDFGLAGIDVLRLFSTHPFVSDVCVLRFLSPHSHLVQVRGLFLGTQAYLLTRRGAKELLRISRSVEMPIDWVMSRYWEFGLPSYCLFPFPVLERYGISAIGHQGREAAYTAAPTDRASRFLYRLKDRIARDMFNRFSLRRQPFGKQPDTGMPFIDRHF